MACHLKFVNGQMVFDKYESIMQVYFITNLMFDDKPIHHEGIMLVNEPDVKNKGQPIFFFPYWDPKEKKEKMMEITENQFHHACGLKNVLALNLQGKKKLKRVVLVFKDVDHDDVAELDKLFMFLPERMKPCHCPSVQEISIKEPLNVVEKLEDAPLVYQYVAFLGNQKCYNQETSVRTFKAHLEANGDSMYTFLKMTVKFREFDSIVNMLTTYIRGHKCSVDGCPNFTKDKCGKCKMVKYCSVDCQKKDFKRHSGAECEKFQQLYTNRVEAFHKMISEVVSAKLSNRVSAKVSKFLSLEQFTARIKPWVLSGYHDHIVKKTFLLGSIKFSSEKHSNIDISENTKKLRPLLKYGEENFAEVDRIDKALSDIAEVDGRSYYFNKIVIMKNLYSKGCLDVSKIKSGEWYKEFMAKNKNFRDRFEDDDVGTSSNMFKNLTNFLSKKS